MATFKDKISNLITSQAPEFVLEQHPKFLEFVKTYYTFMESAELSVTSVQTTDGILLETETNQTNELLLDGSKIGSDKTQEDAGSKVILESSTYGKFTRGETITGQTSNATATVLGEDLINGRLFITAQDKFGIDEIVVGSSSNASASINNYKPNPVQTIQELLNFRDPDKVISNFLTKFRNEFLNTLPENLDSNVNRRTLIKNVKSLYRAKGTSRGHELFFKLLFGLESETIYPRENLLRASDGKWGTNKILRAIATVGETSDLIGRTIIGITSEASAVIENVFKFQIGSEEVTEFILNEDTIVGTFLVDETIRGTASDSDDTFIKAVITGIPSSISITNPGSLYSSTDSVVLSGGGSAAVVQVDSVARGNITDFIVESGGSGYEIGDDIIFTNTDTGGGSATAKVSVVNGGIAPEANTSGMSATDHIVFEDETTKGDIYAGNKIVQESATGTGDITDIRIINPGSNYLSLPKVEVDDTNGSNAEVYVYGSQIGRIQSIRVIESGANYEESPTPPTLLLPSALVITNVSGSFVTGEVVTGIDSSSTVVTGNVVSYDTNLNLLKISHATGTFAENSAFTTAGGANGIVQKNNLGSATVTIGSVVDTDGSYVNQDGHLDELAMRIQDSLYYQDFSYVLKVGRTINDWRDSFKQTMHTSGFYFTAQVDIQTQVNAELRSFRTINSGLDYDGVQGIINTLFSTIFGRRLGTTTDGTTLRVNAQDGVDPDFTDSTMSPFDNSTRDITLNKEIRFIFQTKPKTTIRDNTTIYGVGLGPNMKTLSGLILNTHYASQIQIQQLNNLRLTGTHNINIDGELNQLSDFDFKLKTNFAMPSEIWIKDNDSFDEGHIGFDTNTISFDAA